MDIQALNLKEVFTTNFLNNAPLYRATTKVKLPYENVKGPAVLYRGSLTEESRPVHRVTNYKILSVMPAPEEILETVENMGQEAGIFVDGLIRLENSSQNFEADPRQTTSLRVADIFDHEDGHLNLDIGFVQATPSINGPEAMIQSWIYYKFYFAVAAIK